MHVEFTNKQIELNVTSSRNHIPEIERQICVINERASECCHNFPFKHTPKVVIFAMLKNYELWLNAFPPKGGVSTSVGPRIMLTGVKFDYNKNG